MLALRNSRLNFAPNVVVLALGTAIRGDENPGHIVAQLAEFVLIYAYLFSQGCHRLVLWDLLELKALTLDSLLVCIRDVALLTHAGERGFFVQVDLGFPEGGALALRDLLSGFIVAFFIILFGP